MTNQTQLVLGTRGSALAMWQADYVCQRLTAAGVNHLEVKIIKTRGDRETSLPFDQMQGQGFFTKDIEQALLDGHIDLAVHSHKDLETTLPEGLQITAIPQRMDRRELILFRPESADPDLKLGIKKSATVGTSSIRRIAQVIYHRPDLRVLPLRGNVPTRVEKLRNGEYDAILIAAAGIRRLDLDVQGLEAVELDERFFLPPPAQGALAVQTRVGDQTVNSLVGRIDDPDLREVVALEREVLRRMGGGCHLPLGVVADRIENGFRVLAFLGRGTDDRWDRPRRVSVIARTPEEAANRVVECLKGRSLRPDNRRFAQRRVLITRDIHAVKNLQKEVEAGGGELLAFPTLKTVPAGNPAQQAETLRRLDSYDWVLFSSGIGIQECYRLLAESNRTLGGSTRAAVMGPGSAAIFERLAGRPPDFVATVSTAEGFLNEFIERHAGRKLKILYPTTVERRGALEAGLREVGCIVDALDIYNTVCPDPQELPAWDGCGDAVVLTSPKAARFFLQLAEFPAEANIVSIGPVTTAYLLEKKIMPVYEAIDYDLNGVQEVLDVLFG